MFYLDINLSCYLPWWFEYLSLSTETLSMKGLTLNCMDRKSEAYELVRQGLKVRIFSLNLCVILYYLGWGGGVEFSFFTKSPVDAEWPEKPCLLARVWSPIPFRQRIQGSNQMLSKCIENRSRQYWDIAWPLTLTGMFVCWYYVGRTVSEVFGLPTLH